LDQPNHFFNRYYQEKWTEENCKVESRKLRQGIPVYKIVDYEDDPVQGTFYEPELLTFPRRRGRRRRRRRGGGSVCSFSC
jgi:hypothetical protein